MVRKLRHHEQKLLKKVSLFEYGQDDHRSAEILRRYTIQNVGDYQKYNRLCGSLRKLAHLLAALPPEDPIRAKHETLLLDKLYDMGILSTKSKLSSVEHGVTVSAFARRRLPVVMTRLHMAENVKAATIMVEQGHVRVGTETVTDPAYLVTRSMEDYITWVSGSKYKQHILKYRDKLDDFDLL